MSIKQTNTADMNNQVLFPPIAGGRGTTTTSTPEVSRQSPTSTPVVIRVAAIMGRIRVYTATGEVDITNGPLILGTRVNLTCKLTRPPYGSEVLNYRWYHNCTHTRDKSCEVQNGDSYRVRNDTLSMNVTSHDQAGRYTCAVQYSDNTLIVQAPFISLAG